MAAADVEAAADELVDDKLLTALKRFQRSGGDNDDNDDDVGLLWMHNVYLNRPTLARLAGFLEAGRNRRGRPVQHLSLSTCRFDDTESSSLALFGSYLSSSSNNNHNHNNINAFPKTLKKVHLERLQGIGSAAEQRLLLSSFHHTTTIQVLSLHGMSTSIQGAVGGAMVAALLRHNSTLTTIDLGWSLTDVALVRALLLRDGIVATTTAEAGDAGAAVTTTGCCCRLESIALHRIRDHETFDKLQLVFVKNTTTTTTTMPFGPRTDDSSRITTTTKVTSKCTTRTCLNLCHSFDPTAALTQLRQLLLSTTTTMPGMGGLKDLNVTDNWLHIHPPAILQRMPATSGLQRLNLSNCNINNAILAQMATTAGADDTAATVTAVPVVVDDKSSTRSSGLVELNLSRNQIQGRLGGESLGCLLESGNTAGRWLQTLILSGNRTFGPIGARALASCPSFASHLYLQRLNLSSCRIQDGAMAILAILTTTTSTVYSSSTTKTATTSTTTTATNSPGCCCLKSLDLSDNLLPSATLVAVANYLKQSSSRQLQELYLSENHNLFKSLSSNGYNTSGGGVDSDDGWSFFDALANHKTIRLLHICNVGMNEQQTEQPLLSTLLQNTSLLQVEHSMSARVQNIAREYMRRNHLYANMKRTMDQPISIPDALWPVALKKCSPQQTQQQQPLLLIGPTLAFCLVQKMMESNVFLCTPRRHIVLNKVPNLYPVQR